MILMKYLRCIGIFIYEFYDSNSGMCSVPIIKIAGKMN